MIRYYSLPFQPNPPAWIVKASIANNKQSGSAHTCTQEEGVDAPLHPICSAAPVIQVVYQLWGNTVSLLG